MSLHFTPGLISLLIVAALLVITVVYASKQANVLQEEAKLKAAAAREFEGAKPALIHASDSIIDKLPGDIPVAALEVKAQAALTVLLTRLLAGNALLSGSATLLIGLLPLAFSALPKTVDVSGYKAQLKDEVAKVITEARL